MLLSYYFYLRDDSQARQSVDRPVYFRVTTKGKSKYFSTGIKTKITFWDKKKQRVKKGDPQWVFKNKILEAINLRAQTILIDNIMNSRNISAAKFVDNLKNNHNSTSFFEFVDQVIKEKKSAVGAATYKNYSYQINKLKAFRKEFSLSDIDLPFIRNYEAFLKNELKNKKSTQSKSLKFLRMVCLEAVKHDVLTKSPFLSFKIKEIKGREEYLSFDELQRLEKLYESGKLSYSRQKVLRYFLFSCYTGIAYGDLEKLSFKDVKKVVVKEKEFFIIDNERIKTGTRYRIPLIPKALKLIGRKFQPYQKLFLVYTNQPTNRHLKDIAKECKIETNISFHISRHTFGTHGTSLGIPEKFIMEMMGHKDTKVSRLYSKIENTALIESMADNWK